jgi:protein phosphatase
VRERNEDAVAIVNRSDLVVGVVVDGIGGAEWGVEASRAAVTALIRGLEKPGRDDLGRADLTAALRRAFLSANDAVLAIGEQGRRPGATAVLVVWQPGGEPLHLAHIGNCRAYRLREQRLEPLTADHGILRYLGAPDPTEGPDVRALPLLAGDRFLLCSDGLSYMVSDDQLALALARFADAQACANELCQSVLDRGSRDNVSCVVIEVVAAR